jgi:hypothetical protein
LWVIESIASRIHSQDKSIAINIIVDAITFAQPTAANIEPISDRKPRIWQLEPALILKPSESGRKTSERSALVETIVELARRERPHDEARAFKQSAALDAGGICALRHARLPARFRPSPCAGAAIRVKAIERVSGEKWAVEARAEGRTAGIEWFASALERAHRRDGPFRHVAEALHRRHVEGREIGDGPMDPVEARQREILAGRRVDLSSNAQLGAPVTSEELVVGIHEAAAKACTRTGNHPDDKAPMNALAKAILAAGRKRRNEDK